MDLLLGPLFCSISYLVIPAPTDSFNYSTFIIILDDFSLISVLSFFDPLLSHKKLVKFLEKNLLEFLLALPIFKSIWRSDLFTISNYSVYLSLLQCIIFYSFFFPYNSYIAFVKFSPRYFIYFLLLL